MQQWHNFSLNATVAQSKKCPFEVNTTIELQIITKSDNNGIQWGMFTLPSVPVLLDVFDICGWSEKFSASTTDGNNIGKICFPKLAHLS